MYSFDVFDTLITRRTALPNGIFGIMQLKIQKESEFRLLPENLRNNFFDLRIQVEKLVRQDAFTKDFEDITLDEIYSRIQHEFGIDSSVIERLKNLELEIELDNVIPIRKNIDYLKNLIDQDEKVILISDMYLSSNQIRQMLLKVDLIFESIPIYVSSEYRRSKAQVGLYYCILYQENIDAKDWIHIGNDKNADVNAPKWLKMTTMQYQFEELFQMEKALLQGKESNVYNQLIIGTARNVRNHYELTGNEAIGASLGGSILFPYAWWLVEESIKKGLKRLYFIARDGYIVKKIVDEIVRWRKVPINTFYIYGSRRAWRTPSLCPDFCDLFQLLEVSHLYLIQNVKELADVFEIQEENLIPFLPAKYRGKKYQFEKDDVYEIAKLLNTNNDFIKYLFEVHSDKRKLLIDYIKQEVDYSDHQFAFVELVGSGYTQMGFVHALNEVYPQPVQTFYFRMSRIPRDEQCVFYSFLPSSLHFIIEVLFRAPHGQTNGYYRDGERVHPTISNSETDKLLLAGVDDYVNGIMKFTNEYLAVLESGTYNPVNYRYVIDCVEYLVFRPDEKMLHFIGEMPFTISGREKKVIEFAPVLTSKEIRNIYLFHGEEQTYNYYKGAVFEYSLLRCNPFQKRKIEIYKWIHKTFIYKLKQKVNNYIKRKKLALANNKYPLPYYDLKKNIVLYAAGVVGKAFYQQIKELNGVTVVQWVDKKLDKTVWEDFLISNPNDIGNISYDQIVIAVRNVYHAEVIKRELIEKNIPEDKIYCVDFRKLWVHK